MNGELTGCVPLTCISSMGRVRRTSSWPRLQSQATNRMDAFDWLMLVVMASTKNTKKRVVDNIMQCLAEGADEDSSSLTLHTTDGFLFMCLC